MTEKYHPGDENGIRVRDPFLPPIEYFEEVVSPNVDSLCQDEGSRRMAFNAAVGLYHMVDYICEFADEHNVTWFPHLGVGCISSYRKELIAKCPEFAIAEAVALVVKHYRVGNPRVSSIAGRITSIRREHLIIRPDDPKEPEVGAILFFDFTKPFAVDERLILNLSSGEQIPLAPALVLVRDMWRDELNRISMHG